MTILELKGELYDLLSEIHTEKALLKIREVVKQAVEDDNLWDLLSDEQAERLKKSVEKSKDRNNLSPHLEVKKRHAKWLSK